jgi:CubicO group peptidase (beta-lactamase class C family)
MFKYPAILIVGLVFLGVSGVNGQRPASRSSARLSAAINREMVKVYRRVDRPGAAIIVVKNGQVIFRGGYGTANMELQVPLRPEMVFRLASVTKQFTAVAVMMLVDEGRLKLDDPLTKFFPDYPSGDKITILNLLTHTSGIPDYINKIWPARIAEGFDPDGLVELFKHDPLLSEPGAKEEYSNANYVLLGDIIEKVSGQPYGKFLNERIFQPLGMTHTGYERNQELVSGRVSGYLQKDGRYLNAAFLHMSQLYAAGGLDSTVDDLARWDAAIDAGKLLKPASWARVFSPMKLSNGEMSDYAFGWVVSQFQGESVVSHAGGMPGFRSYVMRIPGQHVYIALLSNDESAEIQPEIVANKIAGIALGKPIVEPKEVHLTAPALEQFVGEYAAGDEHLTVRRDGDRLFSQSPGDPEVEIFPTSAVEFLIKAFDGKLTFIKDSNGRIAAVVEAAGGQELRLQKVK